jgi:uncharacterized membrane protein (Fun14 family)
LPVADFLFSAGGGFLLGAVAGYAIKKVMKIAAVVIGLFVAALAYLSYRGWVDVKWATIEDASKSTLTNASEQVIHALNNTATQFAAHPSTLGTSGLHDGIPQNPPAEKPLKTYSIKIEDNWVYVLIE